MVGKKDDQERPEPQQRAALPDARLLGLNFDTEYGGNEFFRSAVRLLSDYTESHPRG
jgi:hypothetical protein